MKAHGLALALLSCAASAHADQEEPKSELFLMIGNVTSRTKITLDQQDSLAAAGVAAGARFLTRVAPALMLGGELQTLKPSERQSGVLIRNGYTNSKFESLLLLIEAKLMPRGKRRFRPYLMGGLGFHSTAMTIDTAPNTGFAWANTGTRETRKVVDTRKTAGALTLQAGADFPLSDRVVAGLSAAWYSLGKASYESTAVIKQTNPTFAGIEGPISSTCILVHLGMRF